MQHVGPQLENKKRRLGIALCLLVLVVGLGTQHRPTSAQETPPQPAETGDVQADNLLLNGSFEDGFYWKYPNHHIAHNWLRWWIHGSALPEYDDTRDTRPHYDGNKAQVYFKWGDRYEAGIYQVVNDVTPCTYYQLNVYARTHSVEEALPHSRAGLDPTGTQLTKGPSSGAVLNLPSQTVWSREQTQLRVWEKLSVAAEARGSQITAIFYAHPEPRLDQTHYYDTYWDAASLYAIPFPGERLPNPTNDTPTTSITNMTTVLVSDTLTVTWDTASLAHSQIWYNVISPTVPITPSATMTYTSYMPIIALNRPPAGYREETPLNAVTPATHHEATITNLPTGGKIELFVIVRHLEGDTCQSRISDKLQIDIGSTTTTTDQP